MNQHLQRATLLLQRSRFEHAEKELRRCLHLDPECSEAHSLLALCLSEREQFKEATAEAEQAIHLAPDQPYAHYAYAEVLRERNLIDEALSSVNVAIGLDPYDADYFSMRAGLLLEKRQWSEALQAAEQGLSIDPDHLGCTNLRSIALVKLGRRQEAGQAMNAALARAPGNSMSHANQGWNLVEAGDYTKAMEHFSEALRLDPQNEWARQGIIESMKGRNIVYHLMLRYFLWMGKLSGKAQWMVVIGLFFGFRILNNVARNNPSLKPYLWPLLGIYLLFAFLSWTAQPLFNLILRLDRFGRLALSREERIESNWVGACLLASLASVAAWLVGVGTVGLMAAIFFGLLVLPLSAIFKCQEGWPRRAMALYTLAMAAVGSWGLAAFFWNGPQASALFGLFALGIFLSAWIANGLIMATPTR